jgi:hypothetical protein
MTDQAELLPRTLDLLILKAVSLGDVHGYDVLLLTSAGRRALGQEVESWNRLAEAIATVLGATPQEIRA